MPAGSDVARQQCMQVVAQVGSRLIGADAVVGIEESPRLAVVKGRCDGVTTAALRAIDVVERNNEVMGPGPLEDVEDNVAGDPADVAHDSARSAPDDRLGGVLQCNAHTEKHIGSQPLLSIGDRLLSGL
ncbi:hypothetical protein D3C84_982090 [compost metagenome]